MVPTSCFRTSTTTTTRRTLILIAFIVLSVLNPSYCQEQIEIQGVQNNEGEQQQQQQQQQNEQQQSVFAEGEPASVQNEEQQQQQQQQQQQEPNQQQPEQLAPNTSKQQMENPCQITIPPKEVHVSGVSFTASYPGSGAKLTWKLIRAITGIYTGDDHDHNGRVASQSVVAVKTHFPAAGPQEVFFDEKLGHIHSGILLMRNPMNALPSYHNFMYERANNLLNHSTRAPVEVWIQWRNEHFQEEIDNWVHHAKFWLERYEKPQDKDFFLLPYEHLTSTVQPQLGIQTLQNLGQYLTQLDPVIQENAIPTPETYQCVWELFVLQRNVPGEKERRSSLRSGGPVTYPYTAEQIEYMIQSLLRLRDEYAHVVQFYGLMQEYLGTLVYKKREVEALGQGGDIDINNNNNNSNNNGEEEVVVEQSSPTSSSTEAEEAWAIRRRRT